MGTNSIHLSIGEVQRGGGFRVVRHERVLIRLGDGGLSSGRLRAEAMRRVLAVLGRYRTILRRRGVDRIDAVATSAVRQAANGRDFVQRVSRDLKLPLRIISGREEARLTYLGVRHVNRLQGSVLMVAIGGGSAQVALGDGRAVRYVTSVPLGSARLAQRFIRHRPPRPSEIEALQRHARRVWAPAVRAVRRRRWRQALGCSSMIQQVLAAVAGCSRGSIRRRALAGFVWQLAATPGARVRWPGVDPRRQSQLLPAAVTLLAWMEGCGVDTLTCAPGSLREGLMMTYANQAPD